MRILFRPWNFKVPTARSYEIPASMRQILLRNLFLEIPLMFTLAPTVVVQYLQCHSFLLSSLSRWGWILVLSRISGESTHTPSYSVPAILWILLPSPTLSTAGIGCWESPLDAQGRNIWRFLCTRATSLRRRFDVGVGKRRDQLAEVELDAQQLKQKRASWHASMIVVRSSRDGRFGWNCGPTWGLNRVEGYYGRCVERCRSGTSKDTRLEVQVGLQNWAVEKETLTKLSCDRDLARSLVSEVRQSITAFT